MPECHKCKYYMKGHKACLTCKGAPKMNRKGRAFVNYDLLWGTQYEPRTEAECPAEKETAEEREQRERVEEHYDKFIAFLSELLYLADVELLIIAECYRTLHTPAGMATFEELGKKYGYTRGGAHRVFTRALKKIPALKMLFAGRRK